MKLTGTARGVNGLGLIENAEEQAETFYGPRKKYLLKLSDATAERVADTWDGSTTRMEFVAEFIASPDEDSK